MNNINDFADFNEKEETAKLRDLVEKYLRFWPWFLMTIVLSLIIAFIYLRYTDVIYVTEAKVKLIDDKNKGDFSLDMSKIFNKSTINLENEIALFRSFHLSKEVVENLQLNIIYISKGSINSKKISNPPFSLTYVLPQDSLTTMLEYDISITKTGYLIETNSGNSLTTNGFSFYHPQSNFPIVIRPNVKNISSLADRNYHVIVKPINMSALELSNNIDVEPVGKDSDIVSIILKNSNPKQAQSIINNLIKVFQDDGVKDNQVTSKRTIDFINDRFIYLRKELEVIETAKKNYKRRHNLSFIQMDADLSIKIKSAKDESHFEIESQLLLAEMLQNNLNKQSDFELIPSDIGIDNPTINELVGQFNITVLQYQKLATSAGKNNPSIGVLENELKNQKSNIINSIRNYHQKLQTTYQQSEIARRAAENSFTSYPEKEKTLRNIERQQDLKENLYLLLLQKREEASINLAIIVPNTKIIDYAITDIAPVAPNSSIVVLLAISFGLFFPFIVLYILFLYDVKIYNTSDIEKINSNIPILGEIPSLKNMPKNHDFTLETLEAFRALAHNTDFVSLNNENKMGKVFFVTSAIKGEGKTFVSYNLANAFAQLNKKTLLVGADLRNPQLHKYFGQQRLTNTGLSNYLHQNSLQWQDLISKTGSEGYPFDILLSGDIPPNPTLLLSNKRFSTFIDEIKQLYDIIIFDTSPTLLVTDSLIILKHADTTLYVARSGLTEKKLVSYSVKLSEDGKIINMGYVINDINFNNQYNYGYGYGYGNYNSEKDIKKPFYKRTFTRWL